MDGWTAAKTAINEWMSMAEGWVGACVDLVTHHSSYFCPSSSPLASPSTSVTVKRYRWAVHPPVSLLQCLTHQFNITEHWRCNCGWGDSVKPDLDRLIQTSCASSHLSLFSSINRLLTDCTKFWKRQRKSFTWCHTLFWSTRRDPSVAHKALKKYITAPVVLDHVCSISFWFKPT